MKLNFKKIYESTIKTLEAHQIELSIALAAISLLAFMPEDEESKENREMLTKMHEVAKVQLVLLNDMLNKAVD